MLRRRYLLQKIFASALIIALSGFLHSCFEWWPKYTDLTRFFCSINESVWELMKMAWWAALLVVVIELIFFHWSKNRSYLMAKIFSSIVLVGLIPAFFYFFTIFIENSLILDIGILVLAIIIAQIIEYLLLTKTHFYWSVYYVSLFAFLMMSYLFMTFSVKAPNLILFK